MFFSDTCKRFHKIRSINIKHRHSQTLKTPCKPGRRLKPILSALGRLHRMAMMRLKTTWLYLASLDSTSFLLFFCNVHTDNTISYFFKERRIYLVQKLFFKNAFSVIFQVKKGKSRVKSRRICWINCSLTIHEDYFQEISTGVRGTETNIFWEKVFQI